jgi:hypothetical protein
MTAIKYIPLAPGEEFTAKMLDANFQAIAEYTKQAELEMFGLSGHIGALLNRSTEIVVKVPKNRKILVFTVGVAVGVYAYKRRNKIKAIFEEEAAKLNVSLPKQDAEWRTQSPADKTHPEQDEQDNA